MNGSTVLPATTAPNGRYVFDADAIYRMAEKVVRVHRDHGGSTVSPIYGPIGQVPLYAVGVTDTPPLSDNTLTVPTVVNFIFGSMRLLSDPRLCIGSWDDPSTGRTYLDITAIEPDLRQAAKTAARCRQIMIYDLLRGECLPTVDLVATFNLL